MRVCYAVLHYDAAVAGSDVAAYLTQVPIHRALPREMAALGHEVHVVHLYPTDARYVEGGVTFHFVASSRLARGAARVAGRLRRRDAALYEPAWRAIAAIRALQPDIVQDRKSVV